MRGNLRWWLDWMDEFEGGFADRPKDADPGGATMRGITLATYAKWCKDEGLPHPTVEDLKNLDNATQDAIAGRYYWNPIKGDALPGGVDVYLADFTFMSRGAVKVFQAVLGVEQDGYIGPESLAAAKKRQPGELLDRLHEARGEYLRGLANYEHNKNGWERRLATLYREAQPLVEPALLPAERHPVTGLTFYGAAMAGMASALGWLPELLGWLQGNPEPVGNVLAGLGLPPEATTFVVSGAGTLGAGIAIYRRYADYKRAKVAQVA